MAKRIDFDVLGYLGTGICDEGLMELAAQLGFGVGLRIRVFD